MTDSRVAKRYARALFGASLKNGSLAQVDSDLEALARVFLDNAAFREFITSPSRSKGDKRAMCDKALAGAAPLTRELMHLAVDKGRTEMLHIIQMEFAELRRQHEGKVQARVESAMELDEAQRQAVIAKITEATQRVVEAEFTVEPALIGGIRVIYDNYVLDGSVRGDLARMREKVLYDLLKQS
jgi:F-type H+-transporting ATPase subunit delta